MIWHHHLLLYLSGWHLTWDLGHLVGSWHLSWTTLVVSGVGTTLLSVLVVVHATLSEVLRSLHVHHEVLNKLEDFRLVKNVKTQSAWVLLFMILEIGLVSCFFLLELSHFLQLVMVDVELLSIEGLLVELLLGKSSTVW